MTGLPLLCSRGRRLRLAWPGCDPTTGLADSSSFPIAQRSSGDRAGRGLWGAATGRFETGRIFSYDWSADGSQIFLSRGVEMTDVVLITGFR